MQFSTLMKKTMTTIEDTSGIRVLLVDDSMTDRTRAAGLIRKQHADWEITAVAGVQEALNEMAQWRPDVVVSDLVMPGIDGREFLKIVGRDYPTVPVVLITSQGDDQIAAECVAIGAANYVPKRLLAKQLTAVLDEVVQAEEEMRVTRGVLKYVVENKFNFQIKSDVGRISALVNFVRERLRGTQLFSSEKICGMTAAVREALLNAHYHGNLKLNSRPLELSRTEYLALAEQRKDLADFADRSIRLTMALQSDTISFCIADDGDGFDVVCLEELSGEPDEKFANGNGVRCMQSCMETVVWNEKGNEVTLSGAVEDVMS